MDLENAVDGGVQIVRNGGLCIVDSDWVATARDRERGSRAEIVAEFRYVFYIL